MLIDRGHRSWVAITAAALVVATVLYSSYARGIPGGPNGATTPGLWFGVAGAAAMLFAGLLAARKKIVRWPVGSVRWWLKGHIWLGLLSVPLIAFHSAFRWGGVLEASVCMLFAVVIVSGVLGLMLQHILPRIMKVELPAEVIQEQLPRICAAQFLKAERLVGDACSTAASETSNIATTHLSASDLDASQRLKTFYDDIVRPFLNGRLSHRSPLHNEMHAEGLFSECRRSLTEEWRSVLDQLETLCFERRLHNLQTRYFFWLHSWLFVHAPLSYALLVFAALHIFTALYY